MSGPCKDCTWWQDPEGFDLDMHRDQPEGWSACGLTVGGGFPKRETRAAAFDKEGYSAVLLTAPDFGCVQFAKE